MHTRSVQRSEIIFGGLSDGKPQEECGVFAVYNYRGPGNAAIVTYLGLLALQHRGQESAGMAYGTDKGLAALKGMGLVDHVFSREALTAIEAHTMIGHVRYSTTGSSSVANAQPLLARSYDGSGIALAHNGNLTNTRRLHEKLLDEGHIFHTTSDTEIILTYLFRHRRRGLVYAAQQAMAVIEGAYSAVALAGDELVAFRDPAGFRPLVIGQLGEGFVAASETAALDTVGADFTREVAPGEIVHIKPGGQVSLQGKPAVEKALCIFEYIYFARPDSVIENRNVHEVRKRVGSLLAPRLNATVDMIVPSPDSGVSAALGLAEALKIPMQWAIHRNPYLRRTFIQPTQGEREMAVRLKFNPIKELVRNKKIAVVDDSLVRGTTARLLTSLLHEAGAAEVHLCIASPPYMYPCYYGIDIPVSAQLAAPGYDSKELSALIGAKSITFATPEDLYRAVESESEAFCSACFSGCYPGRQEKKG